MTHCFVPGDPVPSWFRHAEMRPGSGLARFTVDGTEILVRLDDPTPAHARALEDEPVAVGVLDDGVEASFLFGAGGPGSPGHFEVPVADVARSARTMSRAPLLGRWWTEDVEVGLCGAGGTVIAATSFVGPAAQLGVGPLAPPPAGPRGPAVAVFPGDRYGLIQPQGVLDVDVVVGGGRALTGHASWRPGFTEVWDLRAIRTVHIAPSRVPDLAAFEVETRAALEGSRTVIVLPDDPRPALAGASHFYRAIAGAAGRRFGVARTAREAAGGLDVAELPDLGALAA